MRNTIMIKLLSSRLVFKDDFREKKEEIKEWIFQTEEIDEQHINDLFNNLTTDWMGWSSYEVEKANQEIKITYSPVFMVENLEEDLSDEESSTLEKLLSKIDKFTERYSATTAIDIKSDLIESPGELELFFYKEEGQSFSPEFKELIEELERNNIEYYITREYSRRDEVGASGGVFEALIFIKETVLSGVTYDLIKKLPSLKQLGLRKDGIEVITKKAAEYLKTLPENLELLQVDKESEQGIIIIKFKLNGKIENFKFDERNNLIRYD